jgi:diguanylate cyclase (GGDEF)-like protein
MVSDYDLLWGILVGVVLAIMVILIWNRRLVSEIEKRGETEGLLNVAREQLKQANEQLANYVEMVDKLSITDELSSLFNRRHFNNLFPQELARAEREQKSIALILIDVDYFKPYNDNYGYQQGDKALQLVAKVLQDSLRRAGDFAFRMSGEEFCVVITVDHSEDAYKIAEKLRQAVEALKLEHAYNQVSPYVTVSIGIKVHQGSGAQAPEMDLIYRLADDALYEAKGSGRNRVTGAEISQLESQGNIESNSN